MTIQFFETRMGQRFLEALQVAVARSRAVPIAAIKAQRAVPPLPPFDMAVG